VRPTGTAIFQTKDCSANLIGPMSPAEIRSLFQTGIAEELGTMDKLILQLEHARAAFESNQSDMNWKQIQDIQSAIDDEVSK
jgi:hypothetical protein